MLDLRDGEMERNPKPAKSKIKEVNLFGDLNPWVVRIGKILLMDFKEKLIQLLKKYHQ